MNSIKRATLSSTVMTGLFLTASGFAMTPAFAAEQAAAVDAPSEADAGAIIVTARRRAEDILKTPVSVSAMTSDDIAKRGITSLTDVIAKTPGINVSGISSGRNDRSFQQIALRGFAPSPSSASSVLTATFIDGVPVASATAVASVSDPERIEILKGPQAAYFGRNTFAGAVNVVNKLPGSDFGGSFSAMRGTRNNFEVAGALEGPIVGDLLSFRITGRSYGKDGSYRNGSNNSQTLGDQLTNTGTLLLVAKPSDQLTIKAFGLVNMNKDGPSAQGTLSAYEVRSDNGAVNVPFQSGSSAGTIIVPSTSTCNLTGFAAGRSATEARVTRPYFCGAAPSLPAGFSPSQNTNENALLRNVLADGTARYVSPSDGVQGYGLKSLYYHMHLNIDYEIGDTGLTLSSLTGYNNEYYSELADLDNYDSTLLRNPANPTGANQNLLTYWDFPFLVERATRDFSQEVRLAYDKGGPLQAVIGASYLKTKADGDLVSVNGQIVGGAARPLSSRNAPQKSKTIGAFFGVTYNFTDQLKVSAEGRYQSDKIYAITGGNPAGLVVLPSNQYGLTPGTYGPLTEFYSQTFNKFLPRVIAQYDITDDIMTYASFSKGANISLSSFNTNFLNGSPAVVATANNLGLGVIVQPETLDNYEIGLKGKLFDGKVRFALSAYYGQWKNQHNSRSANILDVPPAPATCPAAGYTCVAQVVSGVANSGNVNMRGVELDITATPLEGLDINMSLAYNDSSIRTFVDPSISQVTGVIGDGFRGNQMANTSKYSSALGIQYGSSFAGSEDSNWFVRGDMAYKSKVYADAANLAWIKGRTAFDFRAGISKGDFSLEAFVKNAFNDKNYISIANNNLLTPTFSLAGNFSYLSVGLPDLRTFGLKAGYKF